MARNIREGGNRAMELATQCKACGLHLGAKEDPRDLLNLTCPRCGVKADARAIEDLASSLEDALSQLWRVGQTFDVRVVLDTGAIPPSYLPPTDSDGGT